MNEETLALYLQENHGIELGPTDLARTAMLASAALADLQKYRQECGFHLEAGLFQQTIEELREREE